MGSTVSTSSNISRTDVSKSPNSEDQSVVYSTPDSRTCTLRAIVGVETAIVNLKDYTFDNDGTRADIKVRQQGGGIAIDVTYGGNALEVRKDAGQFSMGYGVPRVRCGFLIATKHGTEAQGDALFVTHLYGTTEQRLSLVVLQVWYDVRKRRFMCMLTGPSRHSSILEAVIAMRKAYPNSDAGDSTTGINQTTITGLINNTGGPVYGNLNGSIIKFFNLFQNYKRVIILVIGSNKHKSSPSVFGVLQ